MSDDSTFGDWSEATPANMRTWSLQKLYNCMEMGGGSLYETRARAELERRQGEFLTIQTATLTKSTDMVAKEVATLSNSSDRLEALTKTLKNLTWVLIVLTVFAAAVPIGIEVWKAYHEPQTAPVSAPPTPTP